MTVLGRDSVAFTALDRRCFRIPLDDFHFSVEMETEIGCMAQAAFCGVQVSRNLRWNPMAVAAFRLAHRSIPFADFDFAIHVLAEIQLSAGFIGIGMA